MTDIFPHDAEAVLFDVLLNRTRNIRHAPARNRFRNTFVKRLFRDIEQRLGGRIATTHGNCPRIVTHKTVVKNTDIDTNDVTKGYSPITGQAVNDFVIHRDAHIAGIVSVSQKSTASPVVANSLSRKPVNFASCKSRLDHRRHVVQHSPRNPAGRPHRFQVTFVLENDA